MVKTKHRTQDSFIAKMNFSAVNQVFLAMHATSISFTRDRTYTIIDITVPIASNGRSTCMRITHTHTHCKLLAHVCLYIHTAAPHTPTFVLHVLRVSMLVESVLMVKGELEGHMHVLLAGHTWRWIKRERNPDPGCMHVGCCSDDD